MKKAGIIVCWTMVWQLVSILVSNSILLVGPWETLGIFFRLWPTASFQLSVLNTFCKVFGGFLTGMFAGILCAACCWRFQVMRDILSPFISLMKSIPIVSFIILLLIWQGSSRLSFMVSLLVVYPIMYLNTINGLLHMHVELVQMAKLFDVPVYERVRYIYMPEIYSDVKSGLELSIGMAFRSGIAAEVIGQPVRSIGNALYQSKIFLETDRVFSYTLAAILMAWLAEKMIVFLWNKICRHQPC